jgi:hypothetical protein
MNTISLTHQEYIKIRQVLEEMRISLDRIKYCNNKTAIQEELSIYLASGIFAKIADTANLMEAKLPREESIKLAETFEYYQPPKRR